MDATTGLPAFLICSKASHTCSEPNALPPGEFTRRTTAFIFLSASILVRSFTNFSVFMPSPEAPSISPTAYTTAILSFALFFGWEIDAISLTPVSYTHLYILRNFKEYA